MWIAQICLASFWFYIGIHLLFREAQVWATASHIRWIRRLFPGSYSPKRERFCRDAGLVCLLVGCLLFCKTPFGMGALGLLIGAPPLLILLGVAAADRALVLLRPAAAGSQE